MDDVYNLILEGQTRIENKIDNMRVEISQIQVKQAIIETQTENNKDKILAVKETVTAVKEKADKTHTRVYQFSAVISALITTFGILLKLGIFDKVA